MYVIGDSHTRSFSYHELFVPLFIGPGKETLFLTNEQTKKTRLKVLGILKLLDVTQDFLFIFSEPNIRYCQENGISQSKGSQATIKQAVSNYVSLINEVSKTVSGRIFVLCAIPRCDLEYSRLASGFNAALKSSIRGTGIIGIDVWKMATTEDGTIKRKYVGDYIHANYLFAALVVKYLRQNNFIDKELNVLSKYQWSHAHKIATKTGEVRIWGDFQRKDLLLKQIDQRNWKKYHLKTKLIDRCLKLVNAFLFFTTSKKRISVLSAKEGYVPYRLKAGKNSKIDALENNAIKRNMAKKIRGLYRNGGVNYLSSKEFEAGSINSHYDFVVCMEELSDVVEEFGDIVFNIIKSSDYVFLLSNREYLDMIKDNIKENGGALYFDRINLKYELASCDLYFIRKKGLGIYRLLSCVAGSICKNISRVESGQI